MGVLHRAAEHLDSAFATKMLKALLHRVQLTALLAVSSLAQDKVCNNSPALCSKRYDEITHLGAHDSPFVRNSSNAFSVAGDQFYDSIDQLDSGVRLLTAQIHNSDNALHLCHTNCDLYDAGLLSDWLSELKTWLDGNPNDVVTILLVNSDNIDAPTLGPIFSGAGVDSYAYQPSSTTAPQSEWPVLLDMIATNKRLVIFIASLNPRSNTAAPYLLDEFTFIFENNYDNDSPSDFSCAANRPNSNTSGLLSSGHLPLMNHFLYDKIAGIEIPSVENVENTNAPAGKTGNLGDAARSCMMAYNKAPTFILVDFVNVGPALDTVDNLNDVSGNTSGRRALPTDVPGSLRQ
ncbi:MAG: hypothetical protein M1828_003989 [Chrysothrix sp. TS-e1954]|nr:MAG: hypothetical protein M1828_003989 [Chrysothrix sp. TS-e1954]